MATFKVGDIIIFTDAVLREEIDASPGIKARIKSFDKSEDHELDHCVKVLFDVSEFVEYNKNKWEANYFDEERDPTLTYPETKYYDPKFSYYFDENDVAEEKYFKVDDSEIKVDLDFVVKYLKKLREVYSEENTLIGEKKLAVIEGLMETFGIKE